MKNLARSIGFGLMALVVPTLFSGVMLLIWQLWIWIFQWMKYLTDLTF